MTANGWILALHLLGLFFWIGTLLALSRLLAFHVEQPHELHSRLTPLERRLYFLSAVPGGLLAITAGLLMLHGVGSINFSSPGQALGYYFKPRIESGEPSFWYVTFHVKLVAFTILALCDAWLYRQIGRLSRGTQGPGWPLGALLALTGILVGLIVVWLPLAAMGVSTARYISYGAALTLAAAGFVVGRRLGSQPGRARFAALHGAIASLVLLIIVLVLAKPLSFGPPHA
jgi:uncharacterized membrane protein